MGVSLDAYRASIGSFCNCTRGNKPCKFPRNCFFSNCNHNFSYGLQEWRECLSNEKLFKNIKESKSLLGDIIAASLVFQMLLILSCDVHPNPGPNPSVKNLSLCHANVRSLKPPDKLMHINLDLVGKFDIITVSETWLSNVDSSDSYHLSGYQKPFRRDRVGEGGSYGGVLAWVADHIAAKRRLDLELFNIELMWMEIRSSNKKFILGVVYRAPSHDDLFWEALDENIKYITERHTGKLLILGDLNADPLTRHGRLMQHFADTNSLSLLVKEPTRITEVSSTILDQCITNFPLLVKRYEVLKPISNSDHCVVAVFCCLELKKEKSYKRTMWNFNPASFELFRNAISLFEWGDVFHENDMDKCCDLWTSTILRIAKENITNKSVTVRPNDKPWYNGHLRKLNRQLQRAFNLAKKTKLIHHLMFFKQLRSTYQNELSQQKGNFEQNKYASLSNKALVNPKKWWSLLKSVYSNSELNETIPPLTDGDRIITDAKEKAQLLNEFFVSASTIDESKGTLPDTPHLLNNPDMLENIIITEKDVEDQIKVLDCNKAFGPDEISPYFLKKGGPQIISSLTQLFNHSISTKRYPFLWKMANVIPLHKKDSKSDVNNYRPISLLSTVGKVFERIIFKYVYNYLRDNFIISVHQSGFQPGLSTTTQLIEVYHQFCRAVDSNKEIRVVFLDISKAFDKVWHKGLIFKLQKCGIGGGLLNWFQDYLQGHVQRVVISGQYSNWEHIHAGVPQGSVLGPLLFLLYINDVTNVVRNCHIRLFADDTCLFIEVDDRIETANKINEDLSHIFRWSNQWIVQFSPSKTKSLVISNKKDSNLNPPVFINDQPIDEVTSYKYLGLHFTSNLRWNLHIDNITSKAQRRLNLMLALKWKLDRRSLEVMYKSLVLSAMEYANLVWGGTFDSDISKLEKIHVEGMRLITGATARSNIANLYDETGFMDIKTKCNNAMLIMMHKIKHNKCPPYLLNLLPPDNQDIHTYNLRNKNDIIKPSTRLESFKRSFFPHAINLWNNLPLNVRSSPTIDSFKKCIKWDQNELIMLYYYGERWTAVHHSRMRLGCSKLNYDLCYNLHVIDHSNCSCGAPVEDAHHFLFVCPNYNEIRTVLCNAVLPLCPFTQDTVLFGNNLLSYKDNVVIFGAVHKYIVDSRRFL